MNSKATYQTIFRIFVFTLISVLLFSFVRYFYLQNFRLSAEKTAQTKFKQIGLELEHVFQSIDDYAQVVDVLSRSLDSTTIVTQIPKPKFIESVQIHFKANADTSSKGSVRKFYKDIYTNNSKINFIDYSYQTSFSELNLQININEIIRQIQKKVPIGINNSFQLVNSFHAPVNSASLSKSQIDSISSEHNAVSRSNHTHQFNIKEYFHGVLAQQGVTPDWTYCLSLDTHAIDSNFSIQSIPFLVLFIFFILFGSIIIYKVSNATNSNFLLKNQRHYQNILMKTMIAKTPFGVVIAIKDRIIFSNSLIRTQLGGLEKQQYLVKNPSGKEKFSYTHKSLEFDILQTKIPYQNHTATIQLVFGIEASMIQSKITSKNVQTIEVSNYRNKLYKNINQNFRTPLNSILGMAYFLIDSDLSTEQTESVRTIEDMGRLINDNLDDLLDYEALDNGKSKANLQILDVKTLINSLKTLQVPSAELKKLTIDFTIDHNLPNLIISDKGKLRQILNELISNAIKYSEKGEISVEVKLFNGNVRFEVRDTGIGISQSHQVSIEKSILSLKDDSSNLNLRKGLGLKVAHYYSLLLDSKLQFTSTEGKGSKFYFDIKLIEPHANEVDTFIDNAPQQISSEVKRNTTILLVEDNKINSKIALKLLNKIGFEFVDTATNGREAVQKVHDKKYDIIFMDCQMPVMDGYDATRELREQGIRTPIIALTASVSNDDIEECFNCGMNNHLAKPIQINQLSEIISKYLN